MRKGILKLLEHSFARDTFKTESKGEVMVMVTCGKVKVENTGKNNIWKVKTQTNISKYSTGGTFFTGGYEDILNVLQTAQEQDKEVICRYEKVRKEDIDKDIPIADLTVDQMTAKENIYLVFSGIYDVNNGKWILTGQAVTNPDNDTENLKNAVHQALNGIREQVDTESFFAKPSKETTNGENNNVNIVNNTDTTRNKNSYLLDLVFFVKECETKYDFNFKDNNIRFKVANDILQIIDASYKIIYDDAEVNYSSELYNDLYENFIRYETLFEQLTKENIQNMKDYANKYVDFVKTIKENFSK